MYENLSDAAKVVFREQLIALDIYIRKEENLKLKSENQLKN